MRKTTVSSTGVTLDEHFYIGGYEIYRRYGSPGNITLERHTLHVMDDKQRVALVETLTINAKTSEATLPSMAIRFQYSNHLGTACLELDETGAVITYEEYYPYGSTSYQAGRTIAETSLKRYRYTGRERDKESGLEYHTARYYAPWVGRWTSCDPKGPEPDTNLYVYVTCQPTRLIDPSGRDGWDRFWGGLKAVGGAIETGAGLALVSAGVATGWTGVGLLLVAAGAVVTAHGLDTVQAGVRTVITGQNTDTFTSLGLQKAGLSRRAANLIDAGIGVAGTLGATAVAKIPAVAGAARAGAEAEGLVHLTSAKAAAEIATTETLGKGASTVYAGPASLADASKAGRVLRTLLPPGNVTDVVRVPNAAAGAFRVPAVVGPSTAVQRMVGTVYTAGAGSINLATGAFTRTGPAVNQLGWYGVDAVINMFARSYPTAKSWVDWGPNATTGAIDPTATFHLGGQTTVKIGGMSPSAVDLNAQPYGGGFPIGRDQMSTPQPAGVGATLSW